VKQFHHLFTAGQRELCFVPSNNKYANQKNGLPVATGKKTVI